MVTATPTAASRRDGSGVTPIASSSPPVEALARRSTSAGKMPAASLRAIKVLHTAVWGAVAGCILAIPIAAMWRQFHLALFLSAVVFVECGILALNRCQCPLTGLAARYTGERSDNFDIYLPLWLARYNKTIFGALFAVNEIILLWCWLR